MPSYEDEVGAELEEPEYDELDAEQYALSQYLAESEARQAIERGVAELQEKRAAERDETSRIIARTLDQREQVSAMNMMRREQVGSGATLGRFEPTASCGSARCLPNFLAPLWLGCGAVYCGSVLA